MKLKQWLYGVAALSMLAACSDHDVAPSSVVEEGGEGFIGINIQLPTVPTTRANDFFSDGEASEYDVKDAVLVLFQGADATSAKCTGAFTLKNSDPEMVGANNTQITSHVTRVANVSGIDNAQTSKIFALVMINGNENKIYTLQNPQQSWMLGKTVKEYQEYIVTNSLCSQSTPGSGYANNIFMTNSPLSTVQGGDNPPGSFDDALPVLVELEKKVWPTEREALDNAAGVIHVERAVAKVTCSSFASETEVQVQIGNFKYDLSVDKVWWDMANDLAESYIVRNTNRKPITNAPAELGTGNMWTWNLMSTVKLADGSDIVKPYRMLGHDAITVKKGDVVTGTYYRPYFCQVPCYGQKGDDANKEKKNFRKTEMKESEAVAWNEKGAFYPRENTFPVSYMKYANTTRIGFWVTFKFTPSEGQTGAPAINGNQNLYISGADKSTFFLDRKINDIILNPLESDVIAELSNETKHPEIKNEILKAVKTDQSGNFTMSNLEELVNIECTEGDDGELKISGITFKRLAELNESDHYHEKFQKQPEYDFSGLLDDLNNLGQYYKYTGGKVFYEVRIKHFGDDLTPWALQNDTQKPATTIGESYGESPNNNYLGRYGVVRNNWYDLNITKITKIGHPKDPAIWDDSWPGKPDDNRDQYIAVELRVLSWAKRIQSVVF